VIITLQYLRLQRFSLMVWSCVVLLLTAANASSVAAVTGENALMELLMSMPPAVQRLAGGSFLMLENPVDGFISMKVLMILPVLFGVYAVMAAAAIVSKEQETRTLDFLLALPVDRGQLLRQRFVGIATGLLILNAVTLANLVLFLEVMGFPGSYGRFALTMLGGFAINLAHAGLTLAFSVGSRDYGQVVRFGLGLVLLTFILDTTLVISGTGDYLRYLLLYGAVRPDEMMRTLQVPWAALLIGLSVAGISLWWANRTFATKQLHG